MPRSAPSDTSSVACDGPSPRPWAPNVAVIGSVAKASMGPTSYHDTVSEHVVCVKSAIAARQCDAQDHGLARCLRASPRTAPRPDPLRSPDDAGVATTRPTRTPRYGTLTDARGVSGRIVARGMRLRCDGGVDGSDRHVLDLGESPPGRELVRRHGARGSGRGAVAGPRGHEAQ